MNAAITAFWPDRYGWAFQKKELPMSTSPSPEQLSIWFDQGLKIGAAHLLVCLDKFDNEDPYYPLFAFTNDETWRLYLATHSITQRVLEAYDLKKDKLDQIDKTECFDMPEHTRAFHVGKTYKTKGGSLVRIVAEETIHGALHTKVRGADDIWRYDRPQDRGRCVQTSIGVDYPANLVVGSEVPSLQAVKL